MAPGTRISLGPSPDRSYAIVVPSFERTVFIGFSLLFQSDEMNCHPDQQARPGGRCSSTRTVYQRFAPSRKRDVLSFMHKNVEIPRDAPLFPCKKHHTQLY